MTSVTRVGFLLQHSLYRSDADLMYRKRHNGKVTSAVVGLNVSNTRGTFGYVATVIVQFRGAYSYKTGTTAADGVSTKCDLIDVVWDSTSVSRFGRVV